MIRTVLALALSVSTPLDTAKFTPSNHENLSTLVIMPTTNYQLTFSKDSIELNNRAKFLIKEAVIKSRNIFINYIYVTGNADIGENRRDPELSIRRADMVAKELMKHGVPGTAIIARGLGDRGDLWGTGNVDEIGNRYVNISFQ